jgi:hypothetical protein
MIIFIISVGIAAIISMFSYKNGKVKENVNTKKDADKLDNFIYKNAIPKNHSLLLK